MLDFTNFQIKKKTYSGANGNKISILIDGEMYMLKMPQRSNKNENLSYSNSAISEYIGSHIFNMIGINAQETLLGIYKYHEIDRISVACKDFEKNGYVLKDFASVKNQIIDSNSNGYGTNLPDVIEAIERQMLIDPKELSDYFWDMFIVDALIGNWDRHNGNWGFLYNQESDNVIIAPIYDCGSCLFPQLDDEEIKKILSDKLKFNVRVYDFPTSALSIDNKRINYYSFISEHKYKECDAALKRIAPKINIDKINILIDAIPCISEEHKTFLKRILKTRKEIIIDKNIM